MSESNFNIESCLISKLLETKDILTLKDNQIKPSYFTGDNRNAYLFIQDTFLSSGEVPTVRVFTRKFPHYNLEVHTVSGSEVVGTDESLKFWCDEIRKKVKHNRIADMVESVADKLKDLDTEDAYALIKKEISYIESEVVETSAVDITKDTQSRIDAYLERKRNHGMRGIPTGFKHLDYILKGFEKETLTTVIAQAGTGKTWFQIVVGARCQLANYRVLQLITEMSNDIMRDRYEAVLYSLCYEGFDYGKFKAGNLDMKTEQKYFQFLTEDLPTFEPLILDVATSVMNVSALIDKYDPDIVFIDSAYLMEDDQGAKDDWLRVAHITRDLKKLAKRCKKPIVINTQADKNSSKKVGPEMDSIMYTQAIGQDCLPADTYVLTEQGYKLIQNLENEVFFIFDGFKYKKAHCVRATEDKQVVNIKYLGRTFQCSPNHKLYVFDNEVGSYVWKRAKDIEVGNDYLVYYGTGNAQGFPHILRVTSKRGTKSIEFPIDATEELGRIIGYLIGDGSFNRSHNTVTLSCGYDEEYAKEAVRIVNKYFNLEGCIKLQKTRFSKSEQINVCWYSASFYDWCEFMLTKNNVRNLNPSFIEMNYSFRRGVICGLLQSDGCFSGTFSFFTVHYQIASTLCDLLSSIGVITTISTKKHKGYVSYRVNIKRSCESIIKSLNFVGERKSMCEVPNTTSQVLNIRQPSSYVKELSSCIVDSSDNSNDKLTKRAYEARRKGNTSVLTLKEFEDQLNICNPFIFVPVESVTITDEFVPMYDIQVFSTDKRIITSGIVTHNSDNVLALYRDDVMRQDNEMGIKVLKQREGTLGKVLSNWDFESMNFDEIYFEGSQSDDEDSGNHDDERNLIGVD